MNKTFSIDKVYNTMSCFSVMQVDFNDRCSLVESVGHCTRIMSIFKYYHIIYCVVKISDRSTELIVMAIMTLIPIYLWVLLAHLIEKYFAPALKIVSMKLHMNEYLSGITILTFCNSLPDLITNFMNIRRHAPLFTIVMSNSLAVILLSGGTVCYMKSFKINGACAIRDLLCLIFSAEYLLYCLSSHDSISLYDCCVLITYYVIYLILNIVDLKLMRNYIRNLKRQIRRLKREPYTAYRDELITEAEAKLIELRMDNKLVIHTYQASVTYSTFQVNRSSKSESRGLEYQPTAVDEQETRDILYNHNNPRNLFLCSEFFWALIPIDCYDFKHKGFFGRLWCILISPIVLLCRIFIPVVDYTQDKHGWSKLLNCMQIIITPYMVALLVKALVDNKYQEWHLVFDDTYANWSICATGPLSLFVLLHARTDQPPVYHNLFIILTATTSILFVTIAATEVEVLCVMTGFYLDLNASFVAATVRSLAAALADVIMNLEMAMEGYERMAFAAVLSGPIFNFTIGMGLTCIYNETCRNKGSLQWLTEGLGQNAYIFFMIAVFTTIGWTLTFNFCSRRSLAIFAFLLYFVFLLYSILVEWNFVHEFSNDISFEPK